VRIHPSGAEQIWEVEDLWEASKNLPVVSVEIASLEEMSDPDYWITKAPDDPSIEDEMPRVLEADLSYPVILHPAGWMMDGYHRVYKALLRGDTHIRAVKFTPETLPPEWDESEWGK
jgi:hypothetical protein